MWIKRDFEDNFKKIKAMPIKILKGPRQVGKTAILERLDGYTTIYFDDASVRRSAQENPRLFFDQYQGPLILDEATLAPEIFPELKRRVDEFRRYRRLDKISNLDEIDIWITGSNQTLLQKTVQESLAGRASYFDLNTLSVHELGKLHLENLSMRGGWPELYQAQTINPAHYLDDLIATFIERDIVIAAGIEKKSAFNKSLGLVAGRVGQLFSASDIAKIVGVELVTVQSWVALLEQNGILRKLQAYSTNLNQRLIKAPKIYFEDVGLAVRLQGWLEFKPLFLSPMIGFIVENIVISEVSRFFINKRFKPQLYFVRSKEKVEVDLLVELPNQRYIAIEIKLTPQDMTNDQCKLLDSLALNIIDRWIVSPNTTMNFKNARTVSIDQIWHELKKVY
jgi:predicted AAA+ superfamily ATPase